MRGSLVLTVASLLFVAGSATGGTSSRTSLTVTYWADGSRLTEKSVWTLRCNPPAGTLKRPVVACGRLAAGGWSLFIPVKKGTVCTEIYGGPQVALIVGTVDGRRVWARVQRRDGCEVARWNRLTRWLLPPGGVT